MHFAHKINKVSKFSLQIRKIINFLVSFPIYYLNVYEMAFTLYFLIKFESLTVIKSVHLA